MNGLRTSLRGRSALRGLALVAAWLLASAAGRAPALAATADGTVSTVAQAAEQWLREGFDDPDRALAAIDRELAAPALTSAQRRILQRTRGSVAARVGRGSDVQAALVALDALASAGDALARADADLVRSLDVLQQGRSAQAIAHAHNAAESYDAICGFGVPRRIDCDPFAHWRARQTLLTRQLEEIDPEAEIGRAEQTIALARRAGEPALEAVTQATQAWMWAAKGDLVKARRLLGQAQALLHDTDRPEESVRVAFMQLRMALLANDEAQVDQAINSAAATARGARSPRLMASVQAARSDALVRRGHPAQALAEVQEGLPVARKVADRRLERILLHNGALAHIALGRTREAKAQAERLFELWTTEGTLGEQSVVLREVADALAAAGEPRAALDLYHRERDVTARIREKQQEKAEQELRARFDRDAQVNSIESRTRDNAIRAAELRNLALTQQLWAMAAVAVALVALVVGLLLRRVRAAHRALRDSQVKLKEQADRDPLTGTLNRRYAQTLLGGQSDPASGSWTGSLLLVDVDHFKRINDEHGHRAGDQVLIEVARRLQSALRGGDVVVRWGGEEFLVIAPGATGAALEALAQRLLQKIKDEPVALANGASVAVTVSVGYGAFARKPSGASLTWERALALADTALYTAKNQGRDRAVLIDESALA